MEKELIRLEISSKEIETRLRSVIKGPESDILTECIMSLAKGDSHKQGVLFKALLGIKPECEYEVGDEVVVQLYGISTWDFNIDEMKAYNHIFENAKGRDCMNAKIISIDPYAEHPYTVRVEFYHENSKSREDKSIIPETKTKECAVSEQYIVGRQEEWPEL